MHALNIRTHSVVSLFITNCVSLSISSTTRRSGAHGARGLKKDRILWDIILAEDRFILTPDITPEIA